MSPSSSCAASRRFISGILDGTSPPYPRGKRALSTTALVGFGGQRGCIAPADAVACSAFIVTGSFTVMPKPVHRFSSNSKSSSQGHRRIFAAGIVALPGSQASNFSGMRLICRFKRGGSWRWIRFGVGGKRLPPSSDVPRIGKACRQNSRSAWAHFKGQLARPVPRLSCRDHHPGGRKLAPGKRGSRPEIKT